MSRLDLAIDEAFLGEMAERFPRAAYSCLSRRTPTGPLLTPGEWLAGLRDASPSGVREALVSQLGGRKTDPATAPPVRRLALTILGARAVGRDVGEILADANRWALGHAGDEDVGFLADLMPGDAAKAGEAFAAEIAGRHAWATTAAIETVRRACGGREVFPSSSFLWLRDRDRTMWLAVNGHGRPHPFAEIAGAVCHHFAERTTRRPLAEPWLDDLVERLTRSAA